jgi:hypothetical protein
MLILDVDPWLAAHLAVTVHAHRARLRAAWQATPVQLADASERWRRVPEGAQTGQICSIGWAPETMV